MYAPEIRNCIEYLEDGKMTFSPETERLIDRLFDKMRIVEPNGNNELREMWLRAERGGIEAFGDYEEFVEWGEVSSYDEFVNWWKDSYPDEVVWFRLSTIEREDYRAVFLADDMIYQSVIYGTQKHGHKQNETELFGWILSAVEVVLDEVTAGIYNQRVEQELPKVERFGVIERKALWDILLDWREEYFADITQSEIGTFVTLIQDQKDDNPVGAYVQEMTSGKFYEYCKLGYIANSRSDISDAPAKVLYDRFADGRDDGLGELDPDSSAAFDDWYENRRPLGHPWEVCRGGNSTHISLYVAKSENGYYLGLSGSSWSRSIETIKFYLALRKCGVAVCLYRAREITDRLLERDLIGIVPMRMTPAYCDLHFPGYDICDYINLPEDKRDEVMEKVTWLKERVVRLKSEYE